MPVTVNGEIIDDELIRQEMSALRPQYEAMITDLDPVAREMQLKDWSRENVIERVLLRQEALRDTAPLDEELVAAAVEQLRGERPDEPGGQLPDEDIAIRKEAEARLRIDALVARITGAVKPPRPADISEFYRKNKDRFYAPEFVRCSHIVKHVDENNDETAAREAIGKIEEELNNGRDFAAVANEYSDCSGNGGYLGDVYHEQMVQEFEDVIFALKPGERSGIFRTSFGWHIAIVHEKIPEGVRSLNQVRDEIQSALLAERKQRAIENHLDMLKARARIENVKRGT